MRFRLVRIKLVEFQAWSPSLARLKRVTTISYRRRSHRSIISPPCSTRNNSCRFDHPRFDPPLLCSPAQRLITTIIVRYQECTHAPAASYLSYRIIFTCRHGTRVAAHKARNNLASPGNDQFRGLCDRWRGWLDQERDRGGWRWGGYYFPHSRTNKLHKK